MNRNAMLMWFNMSITIINVILKLLGIIQMNCRSCTHKYMQATNTKYNHLQEFSLSPGKWSKKLWGSLNEVKKYTNDI